MDKLGTKKVVPQQAPVLPIAGAVHATEAVPDIVVKQDEAVHSMPTISLRVCCTHNIS